MDDSDPVLLRRIAEGDERAFERLYARHAQPLLAYAQRLLTGRGPAEETLQDTFVAVWRGSGAFEGRSTVRTWLFGICRRQALKRLRTVPPPAATIDAGFDRASTAPAPEAVVLARADAAAVGAALVTLSAGHREVLDLAFAADLSHGEIAEVLGIPVGTVKSRLFHARAILARALPLDVSEGSRG